MHALLKFICINELTLQCSHLFLEILPFPDLRLHGLLVQLAFERFHQRIKGVGDICVQDHLNILVLLYDTLYFMQIFLILKDLLLLYRRFIRLLSERTLSIVKILLFNLAVKINWLLHCLDGVIVWLHVNHGAWLHAFH